jgi:ubiquinone/menaquinone biosynthesis C-methylase UbiE
MSWYDRVVVPQIVRLGCGCAMMDEHRLRVVPKARGRVLEIGVGAGANLRFYDSALATHVVGIEPSPQLLAMAERARPAGLSCELAANAAEALPFASESFDSIVCTFTLCSVEDPMRALEEARRVLKRGGRLLFCEHGRAPDPGVFKWQRRIEPLWKRAFGGCHLTRPVRGNIERHFQIDACEGAYQGKGPSIAGWMEWGEASAT